MAHIGKELRFVLACLFKLPAFVFDLAEQPCVLDREDRLISKRLQQFDCVLRKVTGLLSSHYQCANNLIGPQQGYCEQCPESCLPDDVKNQGCVLERVCNLDWSPFHGCFADRCLTDTNAS